MPGGAAALGRLMAASKVPPQCLTRRFAEYATGLPEARTTPGWIGRLQSDFEAGGHHLRTLLRQVALSPEFYALPMPGAAPHAKVATLATRSKESR